MKLLTDWHALIASESRLMPDAARQLRDDGFVVVSGPEIEGGFERLSDAYDRAVESADSADVHTGRTGSSTRIDDFVNRGPEFDGIYIHPPVLAACCQVIGGPFKLSGMRARTLHPGAAAERLHVDVEHGADGWPLVGCILMVDAFDTENGATRFVPGSHLTPRESGQLGLRDAGHREVCACGPAGSIVIFNASTWHGHGENLSAKARRSIQAHFVPRAARASPDDHACRMKQETLRRVSDLANYVLGASTSPNDSSPVPICSKSGMSPFNGGT